MIDIKRTSGFKATADQQRMRDWVASLEESNGYSYEKMTIQTSMGRTQVYGLNTVNYSETLVIFPGFRTTALIWDLDQGLSEIPKSVRILMIETNGQPNLSDGHSPDIRSNGYGEWVSEVFEQLNIESAFLAGASFGGLVCMKSGLVLRERIKGIFLFNPACFRMVSLAPKTMYYTLLPVLCPNRRTVTKFLQKIVFNDPVHGLSTAAMDLLVSYELLALKRYKDRTQKPYYMKSELDQLKVSTYLIVGTHDKLIPYQRSAQNAKKHLKNHLISVIIEPTGHGIETYKPALKKMGELIARQGQKQEETVQAIAN